MKISVGKHRFWNFDFAFNLFHKEQDIECVRYESKFLPSYLVHIVLNTEVRQEEKIYKICVKIDFGHVKVDIQT